MKAHGLGEGGSGGSHSNTQPKNKKKTMNVFSEKT